MKIGTETPKKYGEKPGWYEGRLQFQDGKPVLSQGMNYALVEAKPSKMRKHEGEMIFIKATLEITGGRRPSSPGFVLKGVKALAEFEGKHGEKYIGAVKDTVIHSEKYSCDTTEGTDILKDVSLGAPNFPIWD